MKISGSILAKSLAANVLDLTLLPSEQCNLRCRYCYEKFELGRMQDEVVQGVKKLLTRRAPKLDELTLSWFGGEPLLALDVMLDLLDHVRSLLQERPDIRFASEINTNGYLLSPAVFKDLLKRGVTVYQITFDGPKKWHDRKRILPDGRGTFDRIWKNLKAMGEAPGRFTVIIRVHVDRENKEAVPEFLEQCKVAFEGDDRFQVFLRPLSRLGGPDDEGLDVLDGGMEGKEIVELRGMARCRGLAQYNEGGALDICYASKANSFVVRADGRINKCTVALDHPGNLVGRLHEDGTLSLDKGLMLKWMRGIQSEDANELSCPLQNFPD